MFPSSASQVLSKCSHRKRRARLPTGTQRSVPECFLHARGLPRRPCAMYVGQSSVLVARRALVLWTYRTGRAIPSRSCPPPFRRRAGCRFQPCHHSGPREPRVAPDTHAGNGIRATAAGLFSNPCGGNLQASGKFHRRKNVLGLHGHTNFPFSEVWFVPGGFYRGLREGPSKIEGRSAPETIPVCRKSSRTPLYPKSGELSSTSPQVLLCGKPACRIFFIEHKGT